MILCSRNCQVAGSLHQNLRNQAGCTRSIQTQLKVFQAVVSQSREGLSYSRRIHHDLNELAAAKAIIERLRIGLPAETTRMTLQGLLDSESCLKQQTTSLEVLDRHDQAMTRIAASLDVDVMACTSRIQSIDVELVQIRALIADMRRQWQDLFLQCESASEGDEMM